ncbi:MAG: CHRD domain-containing protein [Chloroflexi bacterium]|nr:CHRD domain-containing protein [Chloroflexota bacterium]
MLNRFRTPRTFSLLTLLSLFSLVVGLNLAQAAPRTIQGGGGFTPGNLVVVRVGNGSGSLSSVSTAVFLDEYTTNGDFVQTVPMPTALNGNNRRLTMSGTATSEGSLSLSGDGQHLLLAGYDADVGIGAIAASSSSTFNRVVAKVSLSGLIDTTNVITDSYSANNIRGATGNGDNLWATGTGNPGGVRFLNGMGTTTTLITPTNTRVVQTFGGNLYFSSSSTGSRGIFQIGTGLPTSAGQTIMPIASATSPYGFAFLDREPSVAGVDTLYVADDGTNLRKFSFDGTTWTLQGVWGIASTGFHLAAQDNGANGVDLYLTRGTNSLSKLTDTAAYNQPINAAALNPIVPVGANTAFRGIIVVPSPVQATPTPTETATVTPSETPSPTAVASCLRFMVSLEGSQEVPPSGSNATGGGTVDVDTVNNILSYNLSYQGLSSTETAAHIHGFAPRGANAGVLVGLSTGSPKVGIFNYSEAQEASILAGQAYVNIHTNSFPGGEIRGQIDGATINCPPPTATPTETATPSNTPTATATPIPSCLRFMVSLEGSQEVPPSGSNATGGGTVDVDTVNNILSYNLSYQGLSGTETAAHIHGFAPRGGNAGVLVGLSTGSPKVGIFNYSEAQEANILAGQAYVNIHTDNFPGGEIRGQIDGATINCPPPTATPTETVTPSATATATATGTATPSLTPIITPPPSCITMTVSGSGSQEVPPNISNGMVMGIIEINTVANTINYNLSYHDLSSAETAAHIHGFAPRGSNAGVLFNLPLGASKVGSVSYAENQEANILAGQTYINIHSNNFPGGELRAQLDGATALCATPTPTVTNTPTHTATPTATVTTTTVPPTFRIYLPLTMK